MVRTSIYGNHISLNSHDTVYQSQFNTGCIQYRSLLDMKLNKMSDGSFRPCCIHQFFRNQTIRLHGIIYRNIIFISKMLAFFYRHLSQHTLGSKISRSKTAAFFIHKSSYDKVAFQILTLFVEHSCQFYCTNDTGNSIVISTIVYRIIMRSCHNTRKTSVFSRKDAKDISHTVFSYFQSCLLHDLFQIFSCISCFSCKWHSGTSITRCCSKSFQEIQIICDLCCYFL